MPEQIRLKVGGVTHQQIAVYEEFARNIPGFTPAAQEASGVGPYGNRQIQVSAKVHQSILFQQYAVKCTFTKTCAKFVSTLLAVFTGWWRRLCHR